MNPSKACKAQYHTQSDKSSLLKAVYFDDEVAL